MSILNGLSIHERPSIADESAAIRETTSPDFNNGSYYGESVLHRYTEVVNMKT